MQLEIDFPAIHEREAMIYALNQAKFFHQVEKLYDMILNTNFTKDDKSCLLPLLKTVASKVATVANYSRLELILSY